MEIANLYVFLRGKRYQRLILVPNKVRRDQSAVAAAEVGAAAEVAEVGARRHHHHHRPDLARRNALQTVRLPATDIVIATQDILQTPQITDVSKLVQLVAAVVVVVVEKDQAHRDQAHRDQAHRDQAVLQTHVLHVPRENAARPLCSGRIASLAVQVLRVDQVAQAGRPAVLNRPL
jgi:hypothetical protein